jgi:hypothetical protein
MQIAIRPYVTAGVAAAGVAALVVAPMAPKMDLPVPTVNAAVALAASPFQQALITASTAPIDLVGGLLGSLTSATNLYPSFALQTAQGLGLQIQALIDDPSTIPDFVAQLPSLGNQLVTGVEVYTFGVTTGSGMTAPAEKPGVPFEPTIPGTAIYPGAAVQSVFGQSPLPTNLAAIPANISNGLNNAAAKTDGVIKALGGPSVFVQTVSRSTQAIGTSLIQAQGLVRVSTLNAITGVNLAVVHGGNVNQAIQNGITSIQHSILGDPTAANPNSVAGLGAIKTVTHTIQKAAKDVGTAARGGTPAP